MVRASSQVTKVLKQIKKMSSKEKKQLKARLIGSARKKEPKKQPARRGRPPKPIFATLSLLVNQQDGDNLHYLCLNTEMGSSFKTTNY